MNEEAERLDSDDDFVARLASLQQVADAALKAAKSANDTALENASLTGALANRLALGLPIGSGNSASNTVTVQAGAVVSWIAIAFGIGLSFAMLTAAFFLARDVDRIEDQGLTNEAKTRNLDIRVNKLEAQSEQRSP